MSNYPDGVSTRDIDRAACGEPDPQDEEMKRADMDEGADDESEDGQCRDEKCIYCGSDQLVRVTPSIPGPTGWGWRCKACGKWWDIRVPIDDREEDEREQFDADNVPERFDGGPL